MNVRPWIPAIVLTLLAVATAAGWMWTRDPGPVAQAQDEALWQVAVTDARVMADISRAMTSDAARDVRGYY